MQTCGTCKANVSNAYNTNPGKCRPRCIRAALLLGRRRTGRQLRITDHGDSSVLTRGRAGYSARTQRRFPHHPSIHLPRRGRLRCGSRRRDAVPADGTGTLGITLASPRLHSHLPAGTRGSSVTARNTARQNRPWDMGRDSPWPGTGRSQVRECRARCPQRSGGSSGTGQPSHAPRAGFKYRNNPEWACRAPANCPSSDLKEHRRVSEENEQEL